jgi:hypothetical protein
MTRTDRPKNAPTDQIYFAVTVDRQRAEFLTRMLDVELCRECGREKDLCDGDPCALARSSDSAGRQYYHNGGEG